MINIIRQATAAIGIGRGLIALTVADRIGQTDPLTLNDAWAQGPGRASGGGLHDSVVSHIL